MKRIPIRVLKCGHERPEEIRAWLRGEGYTHIHYQKVGEIATCRECMKDRRIIGIKR